MLFLTGWCKLHVEIVFLLSGIALDNIWKHVFVKQRSIQKYLNHVEAGGFVTGS